MDDRRGRHQLNFFFQHREHFFDFSEGRFRGVGDSDRLGVFPGDLNQLFVAQPIQIRVLNVIYKNIPFGKRQLKQAG